MLINFAKGSNIYPIYLRIARSLYLRNDKQLYEVSKVKYEKPF